MNKPHDPASLHNAALARMQQFMSTSPVPSISTELLATADGELNRELNRFLFDPPSDPELLKGRTIAVCCTNGVEKSRSTARCAGLLNTALPCTSWRRAAGRSRRVSD